MLDLQRANRASAHVSSNGNVETLVFERVMGSIGASVHSEHLITTGELTFEDDGIRDEESLATPLSEIRKHEGAREGEVC